MTLTDWHLDQYAKPLQSTVAFADFIQRTAGAAELRAGTVHDAGCGAGAVASYLIGERVIDPLKTTPTDCDPALVKLAREAIPCSRAQVLDLTKDLIPFDFDVTLLVSVLSFVEDWRVILDRCMNATDKWLFASSLFWPGVSTHTHATDATHQDAHYNVIDQRAFERFAIERGAKAVLWERFDIDKVLDAPINALGSRTVSMHRSDAGGRPLWDIMSGPLLMPWQFVGVQMR